MGPSVSQSNSGISEVDIRDTNTVAELRLKHFAHVDVIREVDADILIATRVRGESLKDYSQRTGISYQTAKSRRWRAEKVLQRHNRLVRFLMRD